MGKAQSALNSRLNGKKNKKNRFDECSRDAFPGLSFHTPLELDMDIYSHSYNPRQLQLEDPRDDDAHTMETIEYVDWSSKNEISTYACLTRAYEERHNDPNASMSMSSLSVSLDSECIEAFDVSKLARDSMKRVVFISLYQCYHAFNAGKIPSHVLDTCVLLFACPKSWVLPHSNAERMEAQSSFVSGFHLTDEFKQFVTQKDAKNQVIWFDTRKMSWEDVSVSLVSMGFNALHSDKEYWNKPETVIHTSPELLPKDVTAELIEPKGRYLPTTELLMHTNPNLIPMVAFEWPKYVSEISKAVSESSQSLIASECEESMDDSDDDDGFVYMD